LQLLSLGATLITYLLPVRHAARPRAGLFLFVAATPIPLASAPTPLIEPAIKRVVTFIDGQNLYRAAKEAFGYHYPNYDVKKLSEAVCQARGWNLAQVRFYTGVPDKTDDARWNHFWIGKLAVMGKAGVEVFSRALRYRNDMVKLPDGTTHTFLRGSEKGIDVRIALDVIRLVVRDEYDVAIVFSQDQDLSEVADEIRIIPKLRARWIRIACAYPVSPTSLNKRGINHSEWIKIERTMYDACLDLTDYR
jgi:uncharacterized LabA/DUF88 family protein